MFCACFANNLTVLCYACSPLPWLPRLLLPSYQLNSLKIPSKTGPCRLPTHKWGAHSFFDDPCLFLGTKFWPNILHTNLYFILLTNKPILFFLTNKPTLITNKPILITNKPILFYSLTNLFYSLTNLFYSRTNLFYSLTNLFYSPKNLFYSLTNLFYSPKNLFYSPKNLFYSLTNYAINYCFFRKNNGTYLQVNRCFLIDILFIYHCAFFFILS